MGKPKILEMQGDVLYEDRIGTNENVTFSSEILEGDDIEITYCRRRVNGTSVIKTSGRMPFLNGMEVDLDINYYSSASIQQTISKAISINTTGITVLGENTNVVSCASTNVIYILRVKKYKK